MSVIGINLGYGKDALMSRCFEFITYNTFIHAIIAFWHKIEEQKYPDPAISAANQNHLQLMQPPSNADS